MSYRQSGPQHIFHAETVPEGNSEAIMSTLDAYREHVESASGTVVLLGFRPLKAYYATSSKNAEEMTNTTMVGTYASMVDGQSRLDPSGGCVSYSTGNGSTMKCYQEGQGTLQSSCYWDGGRLVCKTDSY